MNKKREICGFTLIELLVVIAIIGVLSALAVPNFFAARERARDATRKSDVKQIQKALELYKSDQADVSYPTDAYFLGLSCGVKWDNGSTETYMNKMPCDPSDGTTGYVYARNGTETSKYTLTACLENPADADRDTSCNSSCDCTNGSSYTLTEP